MDDFNLTFKDTIENDDIPEEAIAICAANTALQTPGVADLAPGLIDSFSKNILRKEPFSKGVNVNQSDDGLIIDLLITVEYGMKIPTVAWDVQNHVKKKVEDMTDKKVIAVNVEVQEVVNPTIIPNK